MKKQYISEINKLLLCADDSLLDFVLLFLQKSIKYSSKKH